jgi:hypothetical protein
MDECFWELINNIKTLGDSLVADVESTYKFKKFVRKRTPAQECVPNKLVIKGMSIRIIELIKRLEQDKKALEKLIKDY